MKVKTDKLTEGFIKLMTDMGANFIDVTPKKKKTQKNYLPRSKIRDMIISMRQKGFSLI